MTWSSAVLSAAPVRRRSLRSLSVVGRSCLSRLTVEVVRDLLRQDGLQMQPSRWVDWRTFTWPMLFRRLIHDYEQRLDVSEL